MSQFKNQAAAPSQLAILDWGIGGMGFYRMFKNCHPDVAVCYFSDAGSVPYGKQHKKELKQRLSSVVTFFMSRQVTHLVVACNAMSTVLPFWSSPDSFHITGVIQPALQAIIAHQGQKVGIVGGRRTILSRAYANPLKKAGKTVMQRVAQPLSALIEQGKMDTQEFHTALAGIMRPLRLSDILVLACTHYPAAKDAFQRLSPNARIIDPTWETLQWVECNWHFARKGGVDSFFTTGDAEEMRHASRIAFGVDVGEITKLFLSEEQSK